MITQQLEARGILDDFVEKVSGVNKPYRALLKKPDYEKFHSSIADAIQGQAKWAGDHIHDILHLAHPMTPLNDVQKDRAKTYVQANMPALASFVDANDILEFYKYCFEWGAKAQYQRWFTKKAAASDAADFELTNKKYIEALQNKANYLINQSSLDDTTTSQIIDTIAEGAQNTLTNDEIAQKLKDSFDEVSQARADMIARTESANAMETGNMAVMTENNVEQVDWVAAGDNPCPICEENEDGSPYDIDQVPDCPAHPNCECYRQADTSSMDLSSMSIWDGGDDGE